MQVFLLGFMGAGKTSLGKRLAARLEIPFIDMDQEIEKREGRFIAEIFESDGEAHFRSLERNWITNLDGSNAVVSLGGGAPCIEGVMDTLREKGVPVYLNVPVGMIVSRLMKAENKRPLIIDYKHDKGALTEFVGNKLSERRPYYLRAKIIFESSDVSAEKLDLLADLVLLSRS